MTIAARRNWGNGRECAKRCAGTTFQIGFNLNLLTHASELLLCLKGHTNQVQPLLLARIREGKSIVWAIDPLDRKRFFAAHD